MGSFKGYGRPQQPSRRRGHKTPKRNGEFRIESLEDRRLLSGPGDAVISAPLWTPTSTNLFDAQNGPMANLGVSLVNVYEAYVQSGGKTSQLAAEFPSIQFNNGLVGIQLKSLGGDFDQFQTQLTELGLKILVSSATYGVVDGWVPVNDLPTIASLPQTQSGQADYAPYSRAEYQGIAYNEGETSMFADAARSQFGVDGTGVTIGVLSDSVSQFAGGLADSYKTGDLSSTNPVNVIQDGPAGSTDEGRAMLENIHDIAPGASLAFATGDVGGDLGFGQNIVALNSKADATLINDDLGYADEPFFQDGFIAQGINTVVANGATYFSAAGNVANQGYLSNFRGASGSITGIGSGTFMNFAPSGTSNILLPITTDGPNAQFSFEYDQPFETQEVAGSPNKVTSNVNIYIIDQATGAVVFSAAQNNNNVATQEPLQIVTIPSAGSYYVAIQVVSGANPKHVEFVNGNENVNLVVSQQFGSAGGTFYPGTYGHSAAVNTIGVGATPWWAPTPFLGQNPLANEPFSSQGPALFVFNPDGSPIASGPILAQSPSVTGPDGGNTSFFSAGQTIDTSNPPFPGEPATTTNLVPPNQQALPTFFGTSSATPNVTAVAALLLQRTPGLTPTQIRTAPGRFGRADERANARDLDRPGWLRLRQRHRRDQRRRPLAGRLHQSCQRRDNHRYSQCNHGHFQQAGRLLEPLCRRPHLPLVSHWREGKCRVRRSPLTIPPIRRSFSSPSASPRQPARSQTAATRSRSRARQTLRCSPRTAKASSRPARSASLSQTSPRRSSARPRSTAGRFKSSSARRSTRPRSPSATSSSFARVAQRSGRRRRQTTQAISISITTPASISYTIGTNPSTGQPTYTVTLNYNGLPQTEMPTDDYAIVVLSKSTTGSGVTDIVGNPLDGNFTGAFPSGANGLAQNFVQNLGLEALTAPAITTFEMTPTATNDTGIVGDQNTNISQPSFIGQLFAPFPGTVANVQVYIEFGGIHNENITLSVGTGGRGFAGTFDLLVTTDANGAFTFTAPPLPEGFQHVQAVAVGQVDTPPLPGLASSLEDAFRIDKSAQITGASFTPGGPVLPLPNSPAPNITNVPSLTTLTLNVVDPVTQFSGVFVTPLSILFSALNPASAANISNYSLVNVTLNDANESQFISSATFTALLPRPTRQTISSSITTAR